MVEIVSTIAAMLSSFRYVREGEIGCVTTLGKASRDKNGKIKLIGPGFRLIFPFIQSINRAHIRKNSDVFSDLQITLKNGLSYKFNAYIIYHVDVTPDSIESVLFILEDYREFASVIFEKTIQSVIQSAETIETDAFSNKIKELCREELMENGIIIDDCGLTSFTATSSSQNLIGINYKLQVASESNLLEQFPSIVAAAIGAVPTITLGQQEIVNNGN